MTQRKNSTITMALWQSSSPKRPPTTATTPPMVYEAVRLGPAGGTASTRLARVRPFWAGGDYEHFDYPTGRWHWTTRRFLPGPVVQFYARRGIPYFLFAPGLTALGLTRHGAGIVYADSRITYHNGRVVNTAFATSYGPTWWRSPPDLGEAIKTAQRKGRTIKRTIYQYPPNLLTTQGVLALARHGVPTRCPAGRRCSSVPWTK